MVAVLLSHGSLSERTVLGLQRLQWFKEQAVSQEHRDALLFLGNHGKPDSVILAEHFMTLNIPSMVGHSYGLVFRNRPPRLPSAEEDMYRFYFETVDADGDPVTVAESNMPPWATFVGGVFSGTPPDTTPCTVTFTADDDDPTSASTQVDVNIAVTHPPRYQSGWSGRA